MMDDGAEMEAPPLDDLGNFAPINHKHPRSLEARSFKVSERASARRAAPGRVV